METAFAREFVVFTETLNYAKAADDLYISQPTLRSHMRILEKEIGAPLVLHRGGRVALSAVGRAFLSKARDVVRAEVALIEACRDASSNVSTIAMGTLGHARFEAAVGSARKRLEERYSGCRVNVQFNYQTVANVESVRSGLVDITLCPRLRFEGSAFEGVRVPSFPGDIDHAYLTSEKGLFWASKAEGFAGDGGSVRLSAFEGKTLCLGNTDNMVEAGRAFEKAFACRGVEMALDFQPYLTYSDYMFSSIGRGFGVVMESMYPSIRSREDIVLFTVDEMPFVYDIYLIYREKALDDTAVAFVDVLKEACFDDIDRE